MNAERMRVYRMLADQNRELCPSYEPACLSGSVSMKRGLITRQAKYTSVGRPSVVLPVHRGTSSIRL